MGEIIRARHRQIDLTELAKRIKTSVAFVGHLESGKRRPSVKIGTSLAKVLGLERRELFFLANPRTQALLHPAAATPVLSAWEEFKNDEQVRRLHNITFEEMEMLSRVALLGEVRSPRDFVLILNTVRHAVGR